MFKGEKHKKKLLIVDDEPSIGVILEHYFSKQYQVVVKHNGLEAIKWLQEGNAADCIVADLDMPLMNGLEFIELLKGSTFYEHIPIIILSGRQESSMKVHSLRLGADDYVVKPFNPEELALRVKKLLARIII